MFVTHAHDFGSLKRRSGSRTGLRPSDAAAGQGCAFWNWGKRL